MASLPNLDNMQPDLQPLPLTADSPSSHTGFCHCIWAYLELSEAQAQLSSVFLEIFEQSLHSQTTQLHTPELQNQKQRKYNKLKTNMIV